MKIFLTAAALLFNTVPASAAPITQQTPGCVWLTAQLQAIQTDIVTDRFVSTNDVDPMFGPHLMTIETVVGTNGPQLPAVYAVAQATVIAELHSSEGCAN